MRLTIGVLLTAAVCVVASATPARAADVPFSGTVSGSVCTLVLLNGGTMVANTGNTVISSRLPGATAGRVRVTNTSFARVSAPMRLIDWDHPADDTSYSDVRAHVSAIPLTTGGVTVAERQGNRGFNLSHEGGTSEVTVHLEGTKRRGTFSTSGPYSGVVTVLCD
ncbi:MAG: hypothetical protein AAFO77_05915 [Pseudomonadota bacterium]